MLWEIIGDGWALAYGIMFENSEPMLLVNFLLKPRLKLFISMVRSGY
jgi:hypothetical protein